MWVGGARIVVIGHDRRMVEPPPTPHRERWLHIVHDGEPAPDEDPGNDPGGDTEERHGTRLPPGITRNLPGAPEPHSGDRAAPDPNPTGPAAPTRPDPTAAGAAPGVPAGERGPAPRGGPDSASSGTPARRPLSEPDSGVAGRYGSLAGPPAALRPSLPGAGVGPPRAVSPHQPGPYRTAGYRPAPYGTSPAPRRGGGGAVQAPPGPAPADRVGGGRWVIVRAGPGRWKRRVGWAWAAATVGTAGWTGGRRCSCWWCSRCRSGTACRPG